MAHSIAHAIKNNLVLKILALILGCGFWLMISSLHTSSVWIEIPLSFYNQHDHVIINAPETIQIKLSGSRALLRSIDHATMAVHLDAHELREGKQPLIIEAHNLFLPDAISVVNYTPLNSYVEKITL